LGDNLKKIILMIAFLFCLSLSLMGISAAQDTSTAGDAQQLAAANENILIKDSGKNLSEMNWTFYAPPTALDVGMAVKFTPPRAGWKLVNVIMPGTDGWNNTTNVAPQMGVFAMEVRDSNLTLLYHLSDSQIPYFTAPEGIKTAIIDIPPTAMDGDFYVIFYSRTVIGLVAERDNVTGNSYYYIRETGQLVPGEIQLANGQTEPVNWVIRAVGQ
jgi:hypothetical protein